MVKETTESRKRIVTRRIVSEVRRYHEQFHKGMSMQVLSAKYAKALMDLGGFPEVIEEMEIAGELMIELSPNGARKVLPGIGSAAVQPAEHYY